MIFEAEHDYMLSIEPTSEPGWLRARDRNVELWTKNLARTIILEADGDTVGYVMWTSKLSQATLITINVVPAHRRQGFGRELLTIFVDRATEDGCTQLDLGVHRGNPAQALYPLAGFHRIGTDGDYLMFRRSATSLVERANRT